MGQRIRLTVSSFLIDFYQHQTYLTPNVVCKNVIIPETNNKLFKTIALATYPSSFGGIHSSGAKMSGIPISPPIERRQCYENSTEICEFVILCLLQPIPKPVCPTIYWCTMPACHILCRVTLYFSQMSWCPYYYSQECRLHHSTLHHHQKLSPESNRANVDANVIS